MSEGRSAEGAAVRAAEQYYDSNDADQFYFNIWGGEDIHIGLYESPGDAVREASQRTVLRMAERLSGVTADTRILDIGAGYGGAARYLARRFGCEVVCLNLSETQNARNRAFNAASGLSERVSVVHGNFEALPFERGEFDVVWSQDAILHSGRREDVLEEVMRVLRPGGQLLFTDPMQSDDCPVGVLGPILARIHLETLGSFAFYRRELGARGFEELQVEDLTHHLGRHYGRVRAELEARRDEMMTLASPRYVERMLEGLQHWVDGQARGYLAWGIMHFHRP